MALKTIKNKGKRKGGKKSNRRTYKQMGGNKMVFALLVFLGIMVPITAKFYNQVVNIEENQTKIKNFNLVLQERKNEVTNSGSINPFLAVLSPTLEIGRAIGRANPLIISDVNIKNEIDTLKAQIDPDILYISAEDLKKLLPLGMTCDFGPSHDYEKDTTKVNTEAATIFNLGSPDYVRAPIYTTYFKGVEYFAINMKKYLELVDSNIKFANVAQELTKVIEKNMGPQIEELL